MTEKGRTFLRFLVERFLQSTRVSCVEDDLRPWGDECVRLPGFRNAPFGEDVGVSCSFCPYLEVFLHGFVAEMRHLQRMPEVIPGLGLAREKASNIDMLN